VNGSIDVGLWQINVQAHPQYTQESLYDSGNNAKAAAEILSTEGLTAWSVVKNSTYLVFLPRARTVAGTATGDNRSAPVPITDENTNIEAPGPFDEIGHAATAAVHAGEWFTSKHNWLRIVYVVGGVVLIVAGLTVVANASKVLPSPVKALK
jgi:hypothetical protein